MPQKSWSTPPEYKIDAKKKYTATFKTDKGDIVVQLHADKVPNTVNNFVFLAREGFYNDTIFHRVINDFMAQGGDPTGTGMGGPGYKFKDEFHPSLKHDQPGHPLDGQCRTQHQRQPVLPDPRPHPLAG